MPIASVTKPGVSIRVPPMRIKAPSANSLAGIRPLSNDEFRAVHARPPSRLINQAPNRLSRMSNRIVHQAPITWPTWMMT